ncbi:MAG: thiamine pyrophosphate-dependent enzyme [Desulfatibacillaceae bacterium]|nr:thiamine pyrophosphate-dependent enzyme [Desulfatibacillaceae bacterium]
MASIADGKAGDIRLLMGNEALARGALEAGLAVAAGYPGTPSSEIIETLAKAASTSNLYVEWSVNEKVALEVAAAASFAGLRSLCVMKQNGVNVASDFLLHLAGSGTRGGMVLMPCDDPGALSSVNEGEARHFARLVEIPLLEPATFQQAKDVTRWAFELSETLRTIVMVRSATRLSHASGTVTLGEIPPNSPKAKFIHDGFVLDPMEGPVMSPPVAYKHSQQQDKIEKAAALFEDSPFNTYEGPENPSLMLIASSVAGLYAREAIHLLGVGDSVGLLCLATTWPLPPKFMQKYLAKADRFLVVEEVLPFLEENIKVLAQELTPVIGAKTFFGKRDKTLPGVGELNPDLVAGALSKILGKPYVPVSQEYSGKARQTSFLGAPSRDLTFCPGCPHRASFWNIHTVLSTDNRQGFVCGDIGCYSMAVLPSGFSTLKTLHAMGSGTGVASGFGKLGQFGMDQPVVSVCGDSTFFHAAMPALANAIHHGSDITMVILDNSGTGMTGFQPHPGLPVDALGQQAPALDIEKICKAMGATVAVCDPFDLNDTQETLHRLLEEGKGVKVLITRRICALSPERKGKKLFEMKVDSNICLGENCGCNRLCTRIFRCPGLVWDAQAKTAKIDEVICAGCGVCADICPSGAISKTPV